MGKGRKKDKPAASAGSTEGTPSLKDVVSRYLGIKGRAILALILALGGVWWQWDHIKDLPGVHKAFCAYDMSDWTPKWQPPHADPKRFSVGIAHFEYDESQHFEDLLGEALSNFDRKTGIQPLQFDRTVCLQGQPEEAEKKGHQKALEYLRESGAQVLVWGVVRGKDAARLYWTSSESNIASESAYQPKDFELPIVFQKDLTDILSLVIVSLSASHFEREGHYIADEMVPFIERVRKLVRGSQGEGWNGETRAHVNFILANALSTFGEQKGERVSLQEAVVIYREVLNEWTRERVPLDWAMTQNNLGLALARLGERESGTAHLEQAVTAYKEALKEDTRERVPLDWAMVQMNLGTALTRLGERESGTTHLEQAVTAYKEALKEDTRERVPLDWAMAQMNLGSAVETLGERIRDPALIWAIIYLAGPVC